MYCIIDVETTGTNPGSEKITEIAIYRHDGKQITDTFTSLVNPERPIPWRITQLTGISDKMVEKAPLFCEIAKKIVEITEGCTFVAHNAAFDYNFIKTEFARLAYNYSRNRLCTVRLSRKLIPGLPSYSLGNLCSSLNIPIESRHRAAGDAFATVKLFELLLSLQPEEETRSFKGLATGFDPEILMALPEETGVYYLHNQAGDVIYTGKSLNIKDRIIQHLSNPTTRKAVEMNANISDISYELTGSELIALLLESAEIKRLLPVYNRAQRRTSFSWGLFAQSDVNGYIHFDIKRIKAGDNPITSFTTKTQGRNELFRMAESFNLCQRLCNLYNTKGACFHYTLNQCHGACIGEEPAESYNQRARSAIEPFLFDHDSFLIIDKGRSFDERSVVLIQNSTYKGFGFINTTEGLSTDDLINCIKPMNDNRDARQIIKQHLKLHKVEKIIPIQASTDFL